MLNHFGFGFLVFPHLMIFAQSPQRMSCSQMTSVSFSRSSQPASGCRGAAIYSLRSSPTWFVRNDPGSLRNWHVFQRSDFKLTHQLYLGYKQRWLVRLWTRFALIVFTRRHRFWLSITSVILTGSLGPHLIVLWFLWLNKEQHRTTKLLSLRAP